MLRRIAVFATVFTAAALAGGCASTAGEVDGQPVAGDRQYGVEIRNTVGTAVPLDVFLVPVASQPRLIGRVGPNETVTLDFEEVAVGPYRFLARTIEGRELVSDEFSLAGTRKVRWNLTTNQVSVVERR